MSHWGRATVGSSFGSDGPLLEAVGHGNSRNSLEHSFGLTFECNLQ